MTRYIDASTAPNRNTGAIRLYNSHDFTGMKKAGNAAAKCLDIVSEYVTEGRTTKELDKIIFEYAESIKAVPATMYYRGYPASSCISLNNVVCHGIPGSKVLKNGDILNIDVTLIIDGWHGDTSRMFVVGKTSRKAEILIETTYVSLIKAIEILKPGITTGDIGETIQTYVEGNRMSVVRDLCGHGVGRLFHDHPNILHFGKKGEGYELRQGMIFTIEPMINIGKPEVKLLSDGWTIVTRDKSLSAQFEHTVGITESGYEIFTLSPSGKDHPVF
jgi:methionyl aminopeptidase